MTDTLFEPPASSSTSPSHGELVTMLREDPAAWLRDKAHRRVAADLRNEHAAAAVLELLDELDTCRARPPQTTSLLDELEQPLADQTRPAAGLARSTDPSTSRRAAAAVWPRSGSQRLRLLFAARRRDGITASEACELTGLPYQSASTRLSELVAGGWLEQATGLVGGPPAERESSSGGMQRVLVLTDRAKREAPAGWALAEATS